MAQSLRVSPFSRLPYQGRAGFTLAETMVALLLLGILTSALLLLFARGTRTYTAGRAEQESFRRIRAQIPPLLKEIRGATRIHPPLPAAGSSSLGFNYRVNVGGVPVLKWIQLTWDPDSRAVTRIQRAVTTPAGDPDLISSPEETRVFLTDVDYLRFFVDPATHQLLILEYRLTAGLPAPLTYRYKLLFTPRLPVPKDDE